MPMDSWNEALTNSTTPQNNKSAFKSLNVKLIHDNLLLDASGSLTDARFRSVSASELTPTIFLQFV